MSQLINCVKIVQETLFGFSIVSLVMKNRQVLGYTVLGVWTVILKSLLLSLESEITLKSVLLSVKPDQPLLKET